MNTLDASNNIELTQCLNYVMQLETDLQEKSRELTYQIMYNVFTMIIGAALGLAIAYAFGWRPIKRTK